MILGHVRDNFPRVILALPGKTGVHRVEFIVDTGFDGELALPSSLLRTLDVAFVANRPIRLADGSEQRLACYEIEFMWNEAPRITEVILLEGNPLLGVELLAGCILQIEMNDGGEVSIEEQ